MVNNEIIDRIYKDSDFKEVALIYMSYSDCLRKLMLGEVNSIGEFVYASTYALEQLKRNKYPSSTFFKLKRGKEVELFASYLSLLLKLLNGIKVSVLKIEIDSLIIEINQYIEGKYEKCPRGLFRVLIELNILSGNSYVVDQLIEFLFSKDGRNIRTRLDLKQIDFEKLRVYSTLSLDGEINELTDYLVSNLNLIVNDFCIKYSFMVQNKEFDLDEFIKLNRESFIQFNEYRKKNNLDVFGKPLQ